MFNTLDRITELRLEKGWSVYKLAKESDIKQSTFASWYSREIEPSISMVEKICSALDMSLPEFFSEAPRTMESETRLAHFRKLSDLSQEELAGKSGVSVETICAYEQRKRDISKAQYRIVQRLADVLECSASDLVEEEYPSRQSSF